MAPLHSLVLGDSVACLELFCYCLTIPESTNGATWLACFLFLSECSLSSCDSPTLLCWAGRPQRSTLSLSSGAKARSTLHVLCPKLLILCCLFIKNTWFLPPYVCVSSACSPVLLHNGKVWEGGRVKQLHGGQICSGSLPLQGVPGRCHCRGRQLWVLFVFAFKVAMSSHTCSPSVPSTRLWPCRCSVPASQTGRPSAPLLLRQEVRRESGRNTQDHFGPQWRKARLFPALRVSERLGNKERVWNTRMGNGGWGFQPEIRRDGPAARLPFLWAMSPPHTLLPSPYSPHLAMLAFPGSSETPSSLWPLGLHRCFSVCPVNSYVLAQGSFLLRDFTRLRPWSAAVAFCACRSRMFPSSHSPHLIFLILCNCPSALSVARGFPRRTRMMFILY